MFIYLDMKWTDGGERIKRAVRDVAARMSPNDEPICIIMDDFMGCYAAGTGDIVAEPPVVDFK